MALKLDVAPGESLDIDGGRVRITFVEKKGQKSRVEIEADKDIPVNKVTPYIANISRNGLRKSAGQ